MSRRKTRSGLLARWDAHNQRVLLAANRLEACRRPREVEGSHGRTWTVHGDLRPWADGWEALPSAIGLVVGIIAAVRGHATVDVSQGETQHRVPVRWPSQLPDAVDQVEQRLREGAALPSRIGWR